jgi:hypothetical protein
MTSLITTLMTSRTASERQSSPSFLRTIVMNLLRRGGYSSIRQGIRELTLDIKGRLAPGGVAMSEFGLITRLQIPESVMP